MIRALTIALLASGCTSSDLCAGQSGSCIGLTVEGPPGVSVNQLAVVLLSKQNPTFAGTSQINGTKALPVTTVLLPPDGITGDFVLRVTGELDGTIIGTGETPVTLTGHDHFSVVVTLAGDTDSDAGLPDGAATSACPAAANYFCDDFSMGFSRWAAMPSCTGTLREQITSTPPLWDGQLLQVTDQGMVTNGCTFTHTFAPFISQGELWFRFYFFAKALGSGDDTNLLGLDQKVDLTIGEGPTNEPTVWRLFREANNDTTFGPLVQEGVWTCVELGVQLQSNGMAQLSLYLPPEKMPLAQVAAASVTWPLDNVPSFDFGAVHSPGTEGADYRLDDLAVGSSRIGCEN